MNQVLAVVPQSQSKPSQSVVRKWSFGVNKLISEKVAHIDYKLHEHFNTDNSFVCLQEAATVTSTYNASGTLLQQLTSRITTDFYGYVKQQKPSIAISCIIASVPSNENAIQGKRTVIGDGRFNKAVFSSILTITLKHSAHKRPMGFGKAEAGRACRTITTNSDLATNSSAAPKRIFQFTTSEGITKRLGSETCTNFDASWRYRATDAIAVPKFASVDKWRWLEAIWHKTGVVGCVDGRSTDARNTLPHCPYGNLGELEAKDQTEAARYFANKTT